MFPSNKSKQSQPAAVRPNSTPIDPGVSKKGVTARRGSFSRSLHGCVNCRARRKKCPGSITPDVPDDPCEACLKLKFQCLGYPGPAPDWLRRNTLHCKEFNAEMQQWVKGAKSREDPDEILNLSKYETLSTSGASASEVDGSYGDPQSSSHLAWGGYDISAASSSRASHASSERVIRGTSGRRKSKQSEIPFTGVFYVRPNASSSKSSPENNSSVRTSKVSKSTIKSLSSRNPAPSDRTVSTPATSLQSSTDPTYPPPPVYRSPHDEIYYTSNMGFADGASPYSLPHVTYLPANGTGSESSSTSERTGPGHQASRAGTSETMPRTYAYAANPDSLLAPVRQDAPWYTPIPVPCDDTGLNDFTSHSQSFAGSSYTSSTSYPAYYNPFRY